MRSLNVTLIRSTLFCFLGTIACMGCGKGERSPSGLVVVGAGVHNFGERHQEELLTHSFSLVNQADVPIRITGFKTSCSCVVAGRDEELGKKTLAPGDTFALPVRFTTGAVQGVASGGIFVHYGEVTGTSELVNQNYLSLLVQAQVIPDYRISPRKVDFGVVDGLAIQQVYRTIRVVPEAAPNLEILDITPSNDVISAQLLPKKGGDTGFEIQIGLDVSKFTQSRSFNGWFFLSTNNEKLPKARVEVHAKYIAPAYAEPDILVIGSNERGEVKREVRVTTSRPSQVHKFRCTSGDSSVRVEFSGQEPASEHILQLFVPPCREEPLDSELELELSLFSDDGKSLFRTLRVPVHRFLEKGVENE